MKAIKVWVCNQCKYGPCPSPNKIMYCTSKPQSIEGVWLSKRDYQLAMKVIRAANGQCRTRYEDTMIGLSCLVRAWQNRNKKARKG